MSRASGDLFESELDLAGLRAVAGNRKRGCRLAKRKRRCNDGPDIDAAFANEFGRPGELFMEPVSSAHHDLLADDEVERNGRIAGDPDLDDRAARTNSDERCFESGRRRRALEGDIESSLVPFICS